MGSIFIQLALRSYWNAIAPNLSCRGITPLSPQFSMITCFHDSKRRTTWARRFIYCRSSDIRTSFVYSHICVPKHLRRACCGLIFCLHSDQNSNYPRHSLQLHLAPSLSVYHYIYARSNQRSAWFSMMFRCSHADSDAYGSWKFTQCCWIMTTAPDLH